MRLSREQVEKLSRSILESLKTKDLIIFKSEEKRIYERIITAINEDLKAEDDLEREVEGMLAARADEINSGKLDYRKMFNMIKLKLAKERGVVL